MSYFDHVRCHGCKAMLDPESLHPGMTCPKCGVELSLQDLFGLKAAFDEDAPPDVSLDDLVPGSPPPRPAPKPAPAPPPARPAAAGARPAGGPVAKPAAKPAGRPVPAAPAGSTALVRAPRDPEDEPPGEPEPDPGSALRAMRALKGKGKKR